MLGQIARELGAEADRGDVEEWLPVHFAEVDRARRDGGDESRRLCRVRRDADGPGEVVGSAERNDTQRSRARLGLAAVLAVTRLRVVLCTTYRPILRFRP